MRHTGTLRSWHEDRGFGFIAPTHGGPEIFAHVTAFPRDGSRPVVGEKLSYELGRNEKGKPQAIHIHRQALGGPGTYPRPRARPSQARHRSFLRPALTLAIVVALAGYGYSRYARHAAPLPVASAQRPTQEAAATSPAGDAARFRCDGRTRCSQMTSCAEATFFLEHCPGTEMDGNHDGVPCERQWCTGAFAR